MTALRKVFGIGLSRTGTRSLCEALRILGYHTAHCETDGGGLLQPEDFVNYDAGADITVAGQFERCDELHPDSRFIYTARPLDTWLASIEQHFYVRHPDTLARCRNLEDPLCDVFRAAYGSRPPETYDRQWWLDACLAHDRRVGAYCQNAGKDICALDVSQPDAWRPLCDYLGHPVPDVPFPYVAELPPGQLAPHEEDVLRALARGSQLCVDLGTLLGRSAAVLSSGVGRVVTIDLFEEIAGHKAESDPGQGYQTTLDEFGQRFEDVRASLAKYPNIEVMQADTAAAAEQFDDGSVDLVLVDADHSATGVSADFAAWLPKLKQGGVIVFHDVNEAHPHVLEFITDIAGRHRDRLLPVPLGENAGTLRAFRKRW